MEGNGIWTGEESSESSSCASAAPKQNPAEQSPSRKKADRAICQWSAYGESHTACTSTYIKSAGIFCNYLMQCWRCMFIEMWRCSDTGKNQQRTEQFIPAIFLIPNYFLRVGIIPILTVRKIKLRSVLRFNHLIDESSDWLSLCYAGLKIPTGKAMTAIP